MYFGMLLTNIIGTEAIATELVDIAETNSLLSTKTLIALFVVLVAVLLQIIVNRIYYSHLHKLKLKGDFKSQNTTGLNVFVSAFTVLDILIPFIILCVMYNVNASTVVSIVFVGAALVGLSLQDSAKDLIAGIRIMVDNYFEVGDAISYNDVIGQVVSCTLMTTKLQDVTTNCIISVANRHLTEVVRMGNQFDIDVPISYDEDTDRMFEIMMEVAKNMSVNSTIDSCKFLGIEEFGDSAIMYKLRIFCHPEVFGATKRNANYIIKITLEEHGISIPYSQLDLHIVEDKSRQRDGVTVLVNGASNPHD